jgi:DNA invertase Pin-like site-specific DNA recombinase
MTRFVTYCRVTTDKQGESCLGLEAQRELVRRHLSSQDSGEDQPIAEFVEVESGKRVKNRPRFIEALALCKKTQATLVIARLDRLARNIHFIRSLMKSKVEFVAVDMPQANKLTIHIMAVLAEYEAEQMSQRAKDALEALKARREKLGNEPWAESLKEACRTKNFDPLSPASLKMMMRYRSEGKTLRAIAHRLNALGFRTPNGSAWYASTVRSAMDLHCKPPSDAHNGFVA